MPVDKTLKNLNRKVAKPKCYQNLMYMIIITLLTVKSMHSPFQNYLKYVVNLHILDHECQQNNETDQRTLILK